MEGCGLFPSGGGQRWSPVGRRRAVPVSAVLPVSHYPGAFPADGHESAATGCQLRQREVLGPRVPRGPSPARRRLDAPAPPTVTVSIFSVALSSPLAGFWDGTDPESLGATSITRTHPARASMASEEDCIHALREAAQLVGDSQTKARYEELGMTPAPATIL